MTLIRYLSIIRNNSYPLYEISSSLFDLFVLDMRSLKPSQIVLDETNLFSVFFQPKHCLFENEIVHIQPNRMSMKIVSAQGYEFQCQESCIYYCLSLFCIFLVFEIAEALRYMNMI